MIVHLLSQKNMLVQQRFCENILNYFHFTLGFTILLSLLIEAHFFFSLVSPEDSDGHNHDKKHLFMLILSNTVTCQVLILQY